MEDIFGGHLYKNSYYDEWGAIYDNIIQYIDYSFDDVENWKYTIEYLFEMTYGILIRNDTILNMGTRYFLDMYAEKVLYKYRDMILDELDKRKRIDYMVEDYKEHCCDYYP